MIQRERVPSAAKRLATAMMLLSLLATAGCMTWQRGLTRAAGDVEGLIDPTIDPADQAPGRCEEFSCEP